MFSMAMLQTILNLHPPLRLEPLTTEVTPAGITFRGTQYNFCVSRAIIPADYWAAKGHLKPLTPEALKPLLGNSCPPLSQPLYVTDRSYPYFALTMDYSLRKSGIHRSEIKALAMARLPRNKAYLAQLITYFQQHPLCFQSAEDPQSPAKARHILGSILGAQIAWISCDASSLLKGEARRSADDPRPASLSRQETIHIRQTYGEYISLGIQYRHNNEPLSTFVNLVKSVPTPLLSRPSGNPPPPLGQSLFNKTAFN